MKETLFLHYVKWRTRPSLLLGHLERKKLREKNNCAAISREKVRVGAAQLQLTLHTSPLEYIDEMEGFVTRAAADGVQLLVFPENNSFQLLGLLPGIKELAAKAGAAEGAPEKSAGPSIADVFRFVGPTFMRTVEVTFSYLAKKYGMYIMAGTFPTPQGGNVHNRARLFGPRGEDLGSQDKVHLMPVEEDWGLTRGGDFRVFPTPLGTLAMPVCMDASYYETFRILREAGAEIVMVPIANPEPYNEWLALRGIWPRVQESLVYGIKSALVGEILGFTLTGRAGIFAPLELTEKGDGVLAELGEHDGEGLITATLDLEKLQALRQEHLYLGDENPALEKKYFPHVYNKKQG